jgi:RNA recognition motif-containing protein
MNLFIGNLNPDTRAEGLRILFSEFGEVLSTKVIFDIPTGTSRGFGFVEMAEMTAAIDAIDNLDMSFFEGNIISVKEAKQNTQKVPTKGAPSRGGGFKPRPGGNTSRPSGNTNRPTGGYNSFNRNY